MVCSIVCAATVVSGCSTNKDRVARDAPCKPLSDLTTLSGSYSSENIGINSNGKHQGTSKLMIEVDTDGVITGERSWESTIHSGHTKDGQITKSDSEKIIGVIDPYSCQIGMAEFEESGNYNGRLLNDGSIELVLVQSGERPVVIRNHYKKTSSMADQM